MLAVDTDVLNAQHTDDGIIHYGGQIEFEQGIPGAPMPLPVFGAGAYRSPLLEPGCGCFQHAWVIAEPRFWQLGDPPLHMNDCPGTEAPEAEQRPGGWRNPVVAKARVVYCT